MEETEATEITPAPLSLKPDRTVVFIGETGAGKSTCANSLAQDKLFDASESSFSITKDVRSAVVKLTWSDKDYIIKIVDTIGIGDTDLSHEEVLTRLAVACHECREGINAVFFVVGKRFTKAQADAFDVLWQILFGADIVEYTTVIRTQFRKFQDAKAVKADKDSLKKQDGAPKRIISKVGDRFLYVDNNEDNVDAMEKSSHLMLQYLILKCRPPEFCPPVLEDVKKNISTHVEEQQRLASKEKDLEEQMEKAVAAQSEATAAIKEMQSQANKSNEQMEELLRRMAEESRMKDEKLAMEREKGAIEKMKLEAELKISREMQNLYQKQVEEARMSAGRLQESSKQSDSSCTVM